jgi:CheY-like chemotaxis protein
VVLPPRRTLLLADDSPAIQKVVSLTFEDEGFRVVAVGSGGEALAHLEQDAPDIILADVHMPAPNGYELCARVKRDERLRRVPVLLLVGAFELFDEAEARRVGADGVLTKQPFQSIRELVSKVGGLLGGHPEPKTPDEDVRGVEGARPAPRADAWPDAAARPAAEASAAAPPPPAFDLDDESIETVPADSYAARAVAADIEEQDVEAITFVREETPAGGAASSAPSGFGGTAAQSQAARQESHSFAAAASGFGQHGGASPASSAGFESRPASSPSEDSLLDLDDIDSAPAAEPDDFILDFEGETPAAQNSAAIFEAAPAAEAESRAEAAATVEATTARAEETTAEETPADISPANLSSAWQEFDPLEVSPDAATVPGVDPAAPIFGGEEAAQAVEPWGFEAAPSAADSVAPPSDFEIVTPPAAEESAEPVRLDAAEESAAREPVAASAGFAAHETAQEAGAELSRETIDAIARRVVELMSERVVRDIAWEVVPDLAERLIAKRLEEGQLK